VTNLDQWVPVDAARLVNNSDRTVIAKARGSLPGLVARIAEAETVIGGMYQAMAGQPKAAGFVPRTGSEAPWCWTHERAVKDCDKAGLFCLGEVVQRATDPSGEGATQPDHAAARHRRYIRCLALVSKLEAELYHLAKNQPAEASERPSLDDDPHGPGEGHCISCYRLDRRHEPIAMHTDGRKRYKDKCRFCGDFRATTVDPENDPDGYDPSLEMLEAWHAPGKIVTEDMVKAAKSERLRVLRLKRKHHKRQTVRQASAARSDGGPALTSEDA